VHNSDTLTDVSSLHDLDDDVSDDATQVFTSDGCRTPDDSTENHLSDVTIPSFTVSSLVFLSVYWVVYDTQIC